MPNERDKEREAFGRLSLAVAKGKGLQLDYREAAALYAELSLRQSGVAPAQEGERPCKWKGCGHLVLPNTDRCEQCVWVEATPSQEPAAHKSLIGLDNAQLSQVQRAVMDCYDKDLYRKLLEDHMRVCPNPPPIIVPRESLIPQADRIQKAAEELTPLRQFHRKNDWVMAVAKKAEIITRCMEGK